MGEHRVHSEVIGRRRRRWHQLLVPVLVASGLAASVGLAAPAPVAAAPEQGSQTAHPGERVPTRVVQTPAPDTPPGSESGRDIIADQPRRIDEIASTNDVSATNAERILADPTSFVAANDRIFYVEPKPPSTLRADQVETNAVPYADTFKLNSKPGSARTSGMCADLRSAAARPTNVLRSNDRAFCSRNAVCSLEYPIEAACR